MRKLLLIIILLSSFYTLNSFAQTYGWIDISENIPGETSLSDIFVIGDEVWITCSIAPELYYNNAGGTTLFTIYTTPNEFSSIHMLNPNIGYAGALSGEVYRTTDGGQSWTLLFPLAGSPVADITFPPTGEPGYCCGNMGKIHKVDSTGLTQITSGFVSDAASICFPVSSEEGWVCAEDVIRHYANGQWNADQSYPGNVHCRSIYFTDNQNGWLVGGTGSNGAIIHTTNGINWSHQTDPAPSSGVLNVVFFLDNQNGWAVGNFGRVLSTTNGGANWIIENTGAISLLRGIYFTSSTNGYITGNIGQAFKYTEISAVEEESRNPEEFSLSQNYPNPFNPSTKIKFKLAEFGFTSLKVYDVLGNEVATLINEEKPAGSYEVDFNGKGLPSGVYFYQLSAAGGAGEFLQSKKMILIK